MVSEIYRSVHTSGGCLRDLELLEKILSYYKPYSICSICNNYLCYKHGELAHNPIKRYYFRFLFYINSLYKHYNYLCENCAFEAWDSQYGQSNRQ